LVATLLRVVRVTAGLAESNGSLPPSLMTHVTCRLTAKNRDQLQNPMLGNRVWATFTFFRVIYEIRHEIAQTLAMNFNRSLESNQISAIWKCANISPIYERVERMS